MRVSPLIKILYILVVSVTIFIFNNLYVTLGLLGLQVLLWVVNVIPLRKLKSLKRVRNFIFFLVFFYSFFSGTNDIVLFSIKKWNVGISYDGFFIGLLMGAKLLTMLLATIIVRNLTTPAEFMKGLRKMGLSENYAIILDNILASVETDSPKHHGKGNGSGKGKGKGKGAKGNGKTLSVKAVLKGDFAPVLNLVTTRIDESKKLFANNDLAIIAAFSMIVTFIRFMKIAPGFPIAPGHKNVLIIPFFILASRLTTKKYAATSIGFLSGIIHFISGFGKFGPLGILQFALLGLVIDVLMLLFRKNKSIFVFAFIGVIAGLTRVSIEIGLAWVLGMPVEYYLFYSPYIISQCTFGALSGIVTKYLIKKIN